jgi:hypothetical protein
MEATPPYSSQISWTSKWRDCGASFMAKIGDPGTSPCTCLKLARTSSSFNTCTHVNASWMLDHSAACNRGLTSLQQDIVNVKSIVMLHK